MRIAVVSDIHGNLEALREVLADIQGRGVDRIVSLGDNVGYGPDPEAVMRSLDALAIPSVMGNHEYGLVDEDFLRWFNDDAGEALEITRGLLSEGSLTSLKDLPLSLVFSGCRFVHGLPPDDFRTYLHEMTRSELALILRGAPEPLCFVGHTHQLHMEAWEGGKVKEVALGPSPVRLAEEGKYIVNAGSVGQPRGRDKSAKYVVWDGETRTLEPRFVPYPFQVTAEKILKRGIPRRYANMLCR